MSIFSYPTVNTHLIETAGQVIKINYHWIKLERTKDVTYCR